MLKQLLFVALVGMALGQSIPDWLRPFIGSTTFRLDTIHGHTLEYDDRHDLILMVGQRNCYLIDAPDSTWDSIVHDHSQITTISEEIYHQITANVGMTQMSHSAAVNEYHSRLEQWQCHNKDIFKSSR